MSIQNKIISNSNQFLFKKISNFAILNSCDSFSGIVDHATCPPYGSYNFSTFKEIIQSSSGPRHLFNIPLKDSHLFKIAKLVINFCFKKNF